MKSTKEKAVGILLIILLVAATLTTYLAISNYVESKNIPDKVLPVSKVDTLTCDLYTAINLMDNDNSEHILIDTNKNFSLAGDTILVRNNTFIGHSWKFDKFDVNSYHFDRLGAHIGIAKALSDGRIISVKADFIDQTL